MKDVDQGMRFRLIGRLAGLSKHAFSLLRIPITQSVYSASQGTSFFRASAELCPWTVSKWSATASAYPANPQQLYSTASVSIPPTSVPATLRKLVSVSAATKDTISKILPVGSFQEAASESIMPFPVSNANWTTQFQMEHVDRLSPTASNTTPHPVSHASNFTTSKAEPAPDIPTTVTLSIQPGDVFHATLVWASLDLNALFSKHSVWLTTLTQGSVQLSTEIST